MNGEIREQLEQLREPEFQAFTAKLLPGVEPILGVRIPALRKLAKELAKGDWRTYLDGALDGSYEEIILQGMTLGYAKGNLQEKKEYLEKFIPKIDNWSVCDSVCSTIKLAKTQPEEMWEFLKTYQNSSREFEIRFALVQFLNYYINERYLMQVLEAVQQVRQEDYYVNMAQAWAVSICYREFPKETLPFLKENTLNDFTHNKAIQKITESLKVSAEEKEYVRTLKRG
ncbi:MAG: DNA alkylation repair protein [Lachnospiraceae bacterium]|nr:DNA alkylation repair protein [Lachnospiraceae bacterium]